MDKDKKRTILIAEDDEEDLLLTQEAIKECGLVADLRVVKDGEELLDYLHRRGAYREACSPRPALILLDLRMPRKDGYEALQEIRSDPALQVIPVVVLTTSRTEEDVQGCYALGVNSYIAKPNGFRGLVDAMMILKRYWFEVVSLPS
ncbi:MAG: two-component system response regulator [Candidatus Handelsmanbacteria bacterium RIFCSPLOWO2_12_FULL_64_10]|uniref:Two-component system response regulator n=1 Tax=Handelsmanbacteria sp. (strain RIFCSPLOWO2_12_FULL_64_10) TaxID=1817868 RepID=A0A1F6C5V3_HANXR|nr:MAG: two-component system response regulator [Candidatus Handelsmanbacteria bacterium RIFCSPLOWO2_12_FULL_64_10]